MYTLITIFYVALVGIIIMILLKRREVKHGHPSLVSRLGQGSDHIFQAVFNHVKKAVSYINKHTFIALAQWLTFHVLVHIRKIYVHFKHKFISNHHGKRMLDAVRGRGEIRDHGASIFLKRISHVDQVKK